jgi:GNAT superfamily N-acetyltransferase
MRLDVRHFRDVEATDMDEWRGLQQRVNSADEVSLGAGLRWAKLEPADYLIRLWDDCDLRACAWVTLRAIRVDGRETHAVGVRGVMTDPSYRRRGFGRLVMERAQELIRSRSDCEFGLLFSSVMAIPFYEALGWRTVPGPVRCHQPGGDIEYTEHLPEAPVMAYMRDQATAPPAGTIDVAGLPW